MVAYPSMDEVFKALGDPSRRRLLDSLNSRNGQTLRELSSGLAMTRQSVSKHLGILETANLVTTIRRGREKLHYLNAAPINEIGERWIPRKQGHAAPINEIGERWIPRYERDRVRALADLKRGLEDTAVDKPSFVYTTYIQTTAEELWQALTDPEFTLRYWGITFESDWKPGSPMTWNMRGAKVPVADPEQVILEADPPRRLSYTWHAFTPELAAALDVPEETQARIAAERRSKVTFEIEQVGEVVKLTVVHDGFEPDSLMASLVTGGWPTVLASLKTLLETGESLPPIAEPSVATRLGLAAS